MVELKSQGNLQTERGTNRKPRISMGPNHTKLKY
jgi:hypothetical protein